MDETSNILWWILWTLFAEKIFTIINIQCMKRTLKSSILCNAKKYYFYIFINNWWKCLTTKPIMWCLWFPTFVDWMLRNVQTHVRGRKQCSRLGLGFRTNDTMGNLWYHNTWSIFTCQLPLAFPSNVTNPCTDNSTSRIRRRRPSTYVNMAQCEGMGRPLWWFALMAKSVI